MSTSTPKSKHPINPSFRFDNELRFKTLTLSSIYSSTAVFKVIQSGSEIASCALKLNTIPLGKGPIERTLNLSPPTAGPESVAEKNDKVDTPATIRLNLELKGPLRSEVLAVQTAFTTYFGLIDSLVEVTSPPATKVFNALNTKYAIIPALPVLITLACATPVVLGVCIVGLPFFLPIIMIVGIFAGLTASTGLVLYLSTPHGRKRVNKFSAPFVKNAVSSSVGQQFLYETGARPSPVTLAEHTIPQDMTGKLITSLALDFMGSCSYLIPGAGEAFDLFWAPFQTVCIQAMYDKSNPYIKYVSFAEEIIPFTDALPTASLGWVKEFGPIILENGIKKAEGTLSRYQRKDGKKA
eukprot:CAMPEP_0118667748 /NCGR_PEP_ID=MMETSP0785-20121206/19961_1 /TAXON_ID=91992 /ORGANISM="Bolidomonas pacifica, Strain CCMP 1866" /LENGTH=352 /DNA_ID=CAMNT_0006562241 /DNA_START=191 /DNA_END=1249 /DNA_ORIENTATION=-